MSKRNVFAVVGTGSAPAKVLIEGLNDALSAKDAVSLVWRGKPTASTETVYDYVMDNEIEFTLYYAEGDNPPRVFRESDHGVVQKVRNPERAAVESVEGNGKVLFLWDADDEDEQIDFVFRTKADGVLVLELTNGLAPITDDVDVPEAQEREAPKDDDEVDQDDTKFTKDELENMAASAVKRYGARIGAKGTTKTAIIAELFPEGGSDDEPTTSDDGGDGPESPEGLTGEAPWLRYFDSLSGRITAIEQFLQATFKNY